MMDWTRCKDLNLKGNLINWMKDPVWDIVNMTKIEIDESMSLLSVLTRVQNSILNTLVLKDSLPFQELVERMVTYTFQSNSEKAVIEKWFFFLPVLVLMSSILHQTPAAASKTQNEKE